MSRKCLDIGVIQTFVDGELAAPETENVVRHISVCEECALRVSDLESENEAAFAVLDYELNPLVPTERLREKVFASIREAEQKDSGWWMGLLAGLNLTGLMSRPGAAGFASVALFLGITGTVLWFGLSPFGQTIDRVAVEDNPLQTIELGTDEIAEVPDAVSESPEAGGEEAQGSPGPVVPMRASSEGRRTAAASRRVLRPVRSAVTRAVPIEQNPVSDAPPAVLTAKLEAEDSYLRTISTLNRTVNENKDFVLRPRERVAFERDLAVVNDAIMKMKNEVEKDPQNSGAREVLRSSYRNKIDLLNSVAERAETVASLE